MFSSPSSSSLSICCFDFGRSGAEVAVRGVEDELVVNLPASLYTTGEDVGRDRRASSAERVAISHELRGNAGAPFERPTKAFAVVRQSTSTPHLIIIISPPVNITYYDPPPNTSTYNTHKYNNVYL